MTTSLAPALMLMPLVPDVAPTPATTPPPPSMVIDSLIVIGPKSPGSSTSISPPALVLA